MALQLLLRVSSLGHTCRGATKEFIFLEFGGRIALGQRR